MHVTLPHEELLWVRNKYLHRSNQDDAFGMEGSYDKKGNPDRNILEG
ncbi:hypothetical protein [Kaistella jeonii]|nr:hypothetical protein [Kaistella jeonii]